MKWVGRVKGAQKQTTKQGKIKETELNWTKPNLFPLATLFIAPSHLRKRRQKATRDAFAPPPPPSSTTFAFLFTYTVCLAPSSYILHDTSASDWLWLLVSSKSSDSGRSSDGGSASLTCGETGQRNGMKWNGNGVEDRRKNEFKWALSH